MADNTLNHEIKLYERNILNLSGINKILSFNSEEFLLDSSMGVIKVNGEGLELLSLDKNNNTSSIKGKINAISYVDKHKKNKEDSFLSRLFK